jgi:hypothetical protein
MNEKSLKKSCRKKDGHNVLMSVSTSGGTLITNGLMITENIFLELLDKLLVYALVEKIFYEYVK